MVEEAREFRDRAFLATLFLVGGAALASGLLQIFYFGSFTPGPEFSTILGAAIIFVTAVYETPYRDPALIGLPGPGAHLESRAYLRYPVPIPDALGAGAGALSVTSTEAVELPVSEPEEAPRSPAPAAVRPSPRVARAPISAPAVAYTPSARTTAPGPAATPSVSPRMAQTSRAVSEARQAIAALETLGTIPVEPLGYAPLPPLELKPYMADHPPAADYLEDHLPQHAVAQVDPNVQQSLADLAGLAGKQTTGDQPIEFRNGKPPQDMLSDIESVLSEAPPLEKANGTAIHPTSLPTVPIPGSSEEGIQGVNHAEAELRAMPPVESIPVPASVQPPEAPVPPTPTPAPEVVGPSAPAPVEQPPAVAEPKAEAASPPSELPDEATLDSMAKALEGLISAGKGVATTTAAPSPPARPRAPPTSAPSPPATPPSSAPPAPSPPRQVPASSSIPAEPPAATSATIDDLSRQLEAMKSTLLASEPVSRGGLPSPTAGLPPPPKPKKALPTVPPSVPPAPPPDLNEDELQGVLDQATEVAQETKSRHVQAKDIDPTTKKKRKGNGSGPA